MRILLVLAGTAVTALAQTNTSPQIKQVSLQDCIQLALEHNLDLQIERYNPRIALFALNAAYGAYDPALNFQGQHSHSESGSRLLSGGFSIPGAKSDADTFSAGLGQGLTPWGMTYSLQGNASDSYGRSFTLDTNNLPVPRPFESTSGSATFNVTQPLLKNFWIDATRLAIRVNKNRLKYSELTLKLQIMQTITVLEQAYYDLIAARENVVVQEKAVQLAEELVAQNKKKVEVGALAPLDEKQAEAQAATSRADLIAANSAQALAEHLVKQLMLEQYSSWSDVVLEPSGTLTSPAQSFDLQSSWRRGLTQRPEILQAKLDVERAGIQLKYDKNQLYPQVDLFASYGYNGSGREFSGALYDIQQRNLPTYSYGGQITIPLVNTSARNAYKSSKVTLQQALLIVKRWERDIMKQVDDDMKQAQSSYERVAATRAAREYAADALAAEQKKLEQGKSTTYTVLQMQRDLTAARGSEILALATYNRNLSQLSLDEATTLERLGINLEVK